MLLCSLSFCSRSLTHEKVICDTIKTFRIKFPQVFLEKLLLIFYWFEIVSIENWSDIRDIFLSVIITILCDTRDIWNFESPMSLTNWTFPVIYMMTLNYWFSNLFSPYTEVFQTRTTFAHISLNVSYLNYHLWVASKWLWYLYFLKVIFFIIFVGNII